MPLAAMCSHLEIVNTAMIISDEYRLSDQHEAEEAARVFKDSSRQFVI